MISSIPLAFVIQCKKNLAKVISHCSMTYKLKFKDYSVTIKLLKTDNEALVHVSPYSYIHADLSVKETKKSCCMMVPCIWGWPKLTLGGEETLQ